MLAYSNKLLHVNGKPPTQDCSTIVELVQHLAQHADGISTKIRHIVRPVAPNQELEEDFGFGDPSDYGAAMGVQADYATSATAATAVDDLCVNMCSSLCLAFIALHSLAEAFVVAFPRNSCTKHKTPALSLPSTLLHNTHGHPS